MIFTVAHIVSYLSRFMSLHPGESSRRHTPRGGHGAKTAVFLKPGDKIQLGIQGLGEQNQNVIADPA